MLNKVKYHTLCLIAIPLLESRSFQIPHILGESSTLMIIMVQPIFNLSLFAIEIIISGIALSII